jgi:hypothetical protein
MSLLRPFTEHPASVGETYPEHMGQAVLFGGRMVLAGFACLVHGVLPFLFVRTGSRAISELNEQMIHRRRASATAVSASVTPLVNAKRLSL